MHLLASCALSFLGVRDALRWRVVDHKYGSMLGWGDGVLTVFRVNMGFTSGRISGRVGMALTGLSVSSQVGSSIKFWHDSRFGGLPLPERFFELFGIALDKDVSVEELLFFIVESYHWDACFVCPVQNWELELVVSFMDLIYSGPIRRGGTYTLCWNPSSLSVFEVKSY